MEDTIRHVASQADLTAEIVIIGSGAGGATLAHSLRERGAEVLLVERGGFMPREPANWSAAAVHRDGRYRSPERRLDADGRLYWPRQYAVVGGNTTVWGACLPRFRVEDFEDLPTRDGVSPAWPVSYADLAPYYAVAERLYGVHGAAAGSDPHEPPRDSPYPHDAIPDEPQVAELKRRLVAQGLRPFTLPLGIDRGDGGTCVRCRTCDAYPCRLSAKNDAEVRAVRPALAAGVRLATDTSIHRLVTDGTGRRILAAEGRQHGRPVRIAASTFVVSCGAVGSAVLLLRSADHANPTGLANSSGQVGRNYMAHLLTGLLAIRGRRNDVDFQKTIGVNDWYLSSPRDGRPLGNLQTIGKVVSEMLAGEVPLPRRAVRALTDRSIDWIATSEDLPDPDNRVTIGADGRFGDDPETAPLDRNCKAWDHDNLFVVDASVMPSSAALNPGLTIAAMALRAGVKLAG